MNSKKANNCFFLSLLLAAGILSSLEIAAFPAVAQPEEAPPGFGAPNDAPDAPGGAPDRPFRRKMMERMQEHGPGGPEGREGREGRMNRMGNFINFMSTFLSTVKDPYQAAGLAALSVKDAYKKQGKPLEAVKVLEEQISATKDQSMRNVLLFSLRQIYEENNQQDKVLEVSQRILKENVSAHQ